MVDWQLENLCDRDPEAAYEEAERRIAACAVQRSERLVLPGKVHRLPPEIADLTWLRELDLYGHPIADFTPLTSLNGLRSLKLGSLDCPFPGLDFMRGWRELRALEILPDTPVDLAPLASNLSLRRLQIWCTPHALDVHNLSALADLRAIEHASFYNIQSDRFDVLTEWTELKGLSLTGANLTSVAEFGKLKKLEGLGVWRTMIADVTPLAGLPSLQEINLADTVVHDVSPLGDLPQLAHLNLARTPVSNVSPLADLATLEVLNLEGSAVVDLGPLARLAVTQAAQSRTMNDQSGRVPGLREINLSDCAINDLGPLTAFTQLERINLKNTPLQSIQPLAAIESLRSVDVSGSQVVDLGPPGALRRLRFFYARDTQLADLEALAPATSLNAIDITNSPVEDVRPLRAARDCRTISLRGTRVADLCSLLETGSREEDHRYSPQHLDFRDTPAAHASEQLARLAALAETDKHECFVETKRYLAQHCVKAVTPHRSLLSRLFQGS